MQCRITHRDVEPEAVADNVLRCPSCGEFVAEDTLTPLDPQPRVLVDFGGDDPPDPGWQHLTFTFTVRVPAWAGEDTVADVARRIDAYLEHGSHRDGIYAATEDVAELWDEANDGEPDACVTCGAQIVGAPEKGWRHHHLAGIAGIGSGKALDADHSAAPASPSGPNGVETWGHRVIGVQSAPYAQHDRLLDHYAQKMAETDHRPYDSVRQMLDYSPTMQGILGRNGNWESACKLAGIEPYLPTPIIPIDIGA